MKKLFEFLKKLDNAITHSVLMCCAGLSFIILPESLLNVVILIIGASVSFIAVCLIAAWAFEQENEDKPALVRRGSIIKGSLLLAFGVALMLVRSAVSGTVCVALGILLALYAMFKLSRPGRATLNRSATWYVEGIILTFLIVLGVVTAIYPWDPKLIAGIALLAFGLKLLYDAVLKMVKRRRSMPPRVKKNRALSSDYYTTDFVDRSE